MILKRMEGIFMVLKKPYAFLIKHFKLLHILLCIPIIYLIIKTGAIASFFSSFVSANYYTSLTGIPETYINYFMYFGALIIILLALSVFFLMKQKEKDVKFYMFLMIYYIALFILISISHSILGAIEKGEIEAQTIRMYRDIAWIIYAPQFIFLGFTILRGIGFDLKKFNFEEDAKELEINDLDSEEFELTFGKDAYKYKRTLRRFIREFKYYVLENKITFSILLSVIVVIIGTLLYLNFEVYHKTYKQNKKITHNNLVVTVTDSVLTNLDQGGNVIDKGKYYLALALRIKSNSNVSESLDYENFKIEVANRLINATLDRTSYFRDLGIPYTRETKIAPQEENTYVITYEIDESLIEEPLSLKILESLTFEIGSITPIYKTVSLRYEKVFENKEKRTVDFGKILELSESRIGMVQIELKKVYLGKSYEYEYKSCINNTCQNLKNKVVASNKKTLLVLERMFQIDEYTEYYKARKGAKNFTNDFIKVQYKLEKEKVTSIKDITPETLKGYWVFEVPEEVYNTEQLNLLVIVRGSIYKMLIK